MTIKIVALRFKMKRSYIRLNYRQCFIITGTVMFLIVTHLRNVPFHLESNEVSNELTVKEFL